LPGREGGGGYREETGVGGRNGPHNVCMNKFFKKWLTKGLAMKKKIWPGGMNVSRDTDRKYRHDFRCSLSN
jgi:hypothetical protein